MDHRSDVPMAAVSRDAWTRNLDALATIACIYLALITIGFAGFRFLAPLQPTGATRNPDRTFFAAVNAVTMTGFTQNSAPAAIYPVAGRATVIALACAGALTALIGGGYFLRSVLGSRVPLSRLVLLSIAVIAWPLVFAGGIGWFDALSSGTGFGWASTPAVLWAQPTVWRWIVLAGSVPAAVGPLLLWGRGAFSLTKQVLAAIAIVYLVLLLAFWLSGAALPLASFEALNTRGLGLAGNAPATLPAPMLWLMMLGMSLGAGPAAIAGGLSLLPIVILIRAAFASLKGRPIQPIAGVAIAWVGAFVALLAILLASFASTNQPMPGDRQLFVILSAFCNVGLSHDPLGITGAGLVVICAAMLVGRVLPMVMLCWMAIVAERETLPSTAQADVEASSQI